MWEEKDIEYLEKNYKRFTNKELSKKLNRTPSSIERKLSRLGLKKGNKGSWSDSEIIFFKNNYKIKSNKYLSKILNRTKSSILLKGNKLGLSKDKDFINNEIRLDKVSNYEYCCVVCDDFGSNSLKGLSIHLSKIHKKINHLEYYKNNIGDVVRCHFCGNDGKFVDMVSGYRNLCESDQCLSKSRNTQSIEYLLKQGYSESESIIRLKDLNNLRTINGTESIRNNLSDNPNYTKEKSPNCKEFYLKRGYSESESILRSSDVVLNMQETSHKIRKENPEDYLHTYTTKKEYYLNKGYSEEDSYLMLRDRQTTFSKEICIRKHGEVKGLEVWLDRQKKWHKNYKKSNFSKISQELYQSIWNIIKSDVNSDCVYFASLDENKEIVKSDKNHEYRLMLDKSFILPDFFISDLRKIIEFDGTYYHRLTPENRKREKERDLNIINSGYYILHITEDEYKQNKEKIIQKCIEFLLNEK